MKSFAQHVSEHVSPDFDLLIEEEYAAIHQQIDEKYVPKWTQSAILHVINGNILISDKIFKLMSNGEMARGHVWHTTSPKGLKNVLKIQGTKKVLSARSRYDPDYGGAGVWESGLTLKLEGDVLIGGDYDIMSIPDGSGRRWLRPFNFAHVTGELFIDNPIKDMVITFVRRYHPRIAKYSKAVADQVMSLAGGMINAKHSSHRITADQVITRLKDVDDPIALTMIKKIFGTMVKDYITLSKKMLKRMMGKIRDNIAKTYNNSDGNDEFLVTNFKVIEVMVSSFTNYFDLQGTYGETKAVVGNRPVLISGYHLSQANVIGVTPPGDAYIVKDNLRSLPTLNPRVERLALYLNKQRDDVYAFHRGANLKFNI